MEQQLYISGTAHKYGETTQVKVPVSIFLAKPLIDVLADDETREALLGACNSQFTIHFSGPNWNAEWCQMQAIHIREGNKKGREIWPKNETITDLSNIAEMVSRAQNEHPNMRFVLRAHPRMIELLTRAAWRDETIVAAFDRDARLTYLMGCEIIETHGLLETLPVITPAAMEVGLDEIAAFNAQALEMENGLNAHHN